MISPHQIAATLRCQQQLWLVLKCLIQMTVTFPAAVPAILPCFLLIHSLDATTHPQIALVAHLNQARVTLVQGEVVAVHALLVIILWLLLLAHLAAVAMHPNQNNPTLSDLDVHQCVLMVSPAKFLLLLTSS